MRNNPQHGSAGSVSYLDMEKWLTYYRTKEKEVLDSVPKSWKDKKTIVNPNMAQIGGEHYKRCQIQPWDYTIANDLDYFQGSIIKYVTRWKDKGWIQDLHKARHFLDKYIETMETKHTGLKERPEKDSHDAT